MKTFKEFISEQNIPYIPGQFYTGENDDEGNPIYVPDGPEDLTPEDVIEIIKKHYPPPNNPANLRPWVYTTNPDGSQGHLLELDVIDAIKDDPGNMDAILDDYLTPPHPHYGPPGPPNSTL
tara:strand:- start:84 stop:446 length:363 start_codon:yes stop_codon:yes gene_type:complete